ncbi:hypothetical protein SAMN02745121_08690 [Nannocystis exedens]|uniref:Uncharacterized protein n=1 Tax=Nannocystis exedens TaxID=54 RepID=A0A1I2IG49_9BACT|nr:hypothetical protein [Nannocystis exedens]PCC67183.1 hypothetical protein NAEX_00186 [Nannocystis exedens]SFF41194.1 hypothetical protein SAMN02745121_08690 [Nannocystis exedens]
MVRDLEEFRRLYRLHIPTPEHAAYYLETLARSPRYADLPALAGRFAAFEARLAAQGLSVADYRQQQLLALRDELAATAAFRRLCAAAVGPAPATRNRLSEQTGAWFVSLDLREANFSVLALHDDEGALGSGPWVEFCAARGVDPVLAESKAFRQALFGYLEPKKVQRVQLGLTAALADDLRRDGLEDRAIAMISHDELILAFPGDDAGLADLRARLARLAAAPRRPAVRASVFRSAALEPGIDLRTFYDLAGDAPPALRHRALVGVPGNLFYVYFKRHVLEAPLDRRDLYFRVENRLAQWVVDDLPPSA